MIRFIVILLFVLGSPIAFCQEGSDQQLAQHYFSSEEYEKALVYFERIFSKDPSKFTFHRYYECLIKVKNYKEAEKLLKKQIATFRSDQEYKVLLGEHYELIEEREKADKIYENLIDELTANPAVIIDIYTAFKNKSKSDYALQTLEKGRKLLKSTYPLHFQFAEYYHAVGLLEKMMDELLNLLDYQSNYLETVKTSLSRQIDFSQEETKEYDLLRQKLLIRIQKDPNAAVYSEMLVWLFIQKKNFDGALVQVQAFDKREKEQGRRVFDLGNICVENKEYATARKAFLYVRNLGPESIFYLPAENALLNTRFLEVTTNRNYSKIEIENTVSEYEQAIQRIGKKRSTLATILELAHIQAFYSGQALLAVSLLEEAMKIPGITDIQTAEIKMQLADILVLKGDIWDASLYYMQIEKEFKFEPIGHEAKFKNARIFYYDGEFDFAQSQLSVLKESTSKLIANDAMKLSLFITDNFGLDSNYRAMTWFANGDLLVEQHLFEEAFTLFDSLVKTFPYHSLDDDILLKKSWAMQLQGKWQESVNYLEELLKYHADDILADDALFQLGDLLENQLNNTEKAAECYRRILFDYKGSLYVVEARKRFRLLRGDKSEDI
jgi:tetratricopeptide (TPR) repeat protein